MCILNVTTVCPECGTKETHSIVNPGLPFASMIACKGCNLPYNTFGNVASMDSANSTITESGIVLVHV